MCIAMPSIADSKKLVEDRISTDVNHDAILASLRHEIDSHNRDKAHTRRHRRHDHADHDEDGRHERTASALRFRFKHDKRRSLQDRKKSKHRKHAQPELQPSAEHNADKSETVHPFPREPATSPSAEASDDAFLASLLDALADDEAASYWESVYSQPIHTYERPGVQTEAGGIEHMNDEEYAAWVKRRMWEKQHPEIVAERDRLEARKREAEDLKRKRKEDFVRQRQREAWNRASRARSPDEHDYVFDFASTNSSVRNTADAIDTAQWQRAWLSYLEAWERLKTAGLASHPTDISKLLPWPVLATKPPTRPNIEEFLQRMPRSDAETRRRLLKVERVRWHPDKIQHRFGGQVDEGTMKVVTGIFQIIDALWTKEAAKS